MRCGVEPCVVSCGRDGGWDSNSQEVMMEVGSRVCGGRGLRVGLEVVEGPVKGLCCW
jgi:hypothetical protein